MRYERLNNIVGWLVFAVAATVYMMTIEPTVSFWDCGEFISACYKLQVVHPPGAPLFLMIGRLFTLFAPEPAAVAAAVNAMSGISSAFTILFLFWTITAFGRKMAEKENPELTVGQRIAIMGAGAVGALAYCFSDSFWFSAVEGEVYALSSLFTALVFWAILKWDRHADEPDSNRWLILIAYLMGLSIGVHLLNLLAIPAICFVYYFRKVKNTSTMGVITTGVIGMAILALIQYGVILYLPKIATRFELMFVNGMGMPFGSGAIVMILLLLGGMIYGYFYTRKKGMVIWNTAILGLAFVLMGYSSYTSTIVRSKANPNIDMNNPEEAFSLLSYLSREQYGDRPLLYGPYFTAELVDQEEGPMKYYRGKDKYEEAGREPIPVFDPKQSTLFPRAYRRAGTMQRHIDFYKSWLKLRDGQVPSFADNLNFLFSYQLGHMWARYFFWNFVGRQNDIQGHGNDPEKGNWISGFSFIDEPRIGKQENMPAHKAANKGNNAYYFLPLLLGIIGLYYQMKKDNKDFWVVMILFLFTGILINVYLNPEPLQPRERDYAYSASFYTYAIWIGLGVMALFDWLRKKSPETVAAMAVTAVSLVAVPGLMAQQNWDDHNRGNKYTARDFAINYLESCAPNAILFTMGDNDTYPLWYAQEVEGIRTDVKIVNLSLLGTDWYINQMRQDSRDGKGKGVKFSIDQSKIVQGLRDYIPFYDAKLPGAAELGEMMTFMTSDEPGAKLATQSGEQVNYMPTKEVYIKVNKEKVLKDGYIPQEFIPLVQDTLKFTIPRGGLLKNDLMVLDLIASNGFERPIYFTISMGPDSYLGLQEYFQLEGLNYRFVPYRTPSQQGETFGSVHTDLMFNNVMTKFRWGNMDKGIYIDPETSRMTINLRSNFIRLAEALFAKGDKAKAIQVLDRCDQVMPNEYVPYILYNYRIVELYYLCGATDKAKKISNILFNMYESEARYYSSLAPKQRNFYERDLMNAGAIMNELSRMARTFNETKLAEEYERRSKPYSTPPQF